jgi:hypothetical protein
LYSPKDTSPHFRRKRIGFEESFGKRGAEVFTGGKDVKGKVEAKVSAFLLCKDRGRMSRPNE